MLLRLGGSDAAASGRRRAGGGDEAESGLLRRWGGAMLCSFRHNTHMMTMINTQDLDHNKTETKLQKKNAAM